MKTNLKATRPRWESRDRRFFKRQALTALVLLALPYVVLVFLAPQGTVYTGALFNPGDTFLYYGQIAHAQNGFWLFEDYFTYVPGPPLLAYTLYSLIGHLTPAALGAAGIGFSFHAFRLLIAAAFLWQAWKLYGEALPSRAARRMAFLFMAFTSGAGVYQLLVPAIKGAEPPFDLLITESSTFYGLVYSPHFAAVLLGLVVFMRALFHVQTAKGSKAFMAAAAGGGGALLATTVHPDKAAVMAIATVIFLGWALLYKKTSWARAALSLATLVPSVPYVLYSLSLTATDPHIRAVIAQGLPHESVNSPVAYYAFGFGLPLFFALFALPRFFRRKAHAPLGHALLLAFVVAGFAVAMAPFHNVGHRAEGIQFALAALAGEGVMRVVPRLWRARAFNAMARKRILGYGRKKLRLFTLNMTVILSASSVLALAFASPRWALADAPQAYISGDDIAAMSWLRERHAPGDIGVGEGTSDQFLVAYAGVRAAWGSWAYTPDYDKEGATLAGFYLGKVEPEGYLRQRNIRWVYFGPRETRYARIRPDKLPYLKRAYASGTTAIYEVTLAK